MRATGVAIMQMDEGLDTGDVLRRGVTCRSAPTTTAGELHDALAALGAPLHAARRSQTGAAGTLQPRPQPAAGVTYAAKLIAGRGAHRLDAIPRAAIDRRIRAFNPWPVAETRLAASR